MARYTWKSEYFCGNKISDYGLKNGYVDYAALAKSFDAVLNNEIMQKTWNVGYWEQVSGFADNSEEIEELEEKLEEMEEKLEEMEEENKADFEKNNHELENIALAIDMEILKKEIEEAREQIAELEQEQDYQPEVYQWYIVSDGGAQILEEFGEILYYNEELDMYLWGVTHYGTAWAYVLTDIKLELDEQF